MQAEPSNARSERQQIRDEVVDLPAAQVRRPAVSISRVPLGQELDQAGARAVVQVRCRATEFNGRGVERPMALIKRARRSDIVMLEVSAEGPGVADCAAGLRALEQGLSATRRGREPAVCRRWTGQRLKALEVLINRRGDILIGGSKQDVCQTGANGGRRCFPDTSAHGGWGSMRPDQAPGVLGVADAIVEQVPVQTVNSTIIGMATCATLPPLKRERCVVEQQLSPSNCGDRSGRPRGNGVVRGRRIEVGTSSVSEK